MNELASNHLMQQVRRLFGEAPCRLQVAALPWRKAGDGVEIMLITSRDTGRWVVPKGWPEHGEHLCDAAAREAEEEAGIGGAVSRNVIGRYFYFKMTSSNDGVPCEVLVFPFEVDRVAKKWPEKKQRERRWFTSAEASSLVQEPDLARLIDNFAADPRGTKAARGAA